MYKIFIQIIAEKIYLAVFFHQRLDTVGAVALDIHGNTAAAVSSGGLILKLPGRVGQVCLFSRLAVALYVIMRNMVMS